MSWFGTRTAILEILENIELPDGNPLTEAIYGAIGSCEWSLKQKEAVRNWDPYYGSIFPDVFDPKNRPHANELTDKEKQAVWKELADQTSQFWSERRARWLIERLPKKADYWREVDDNAGAWGIYRTKEGGWLTEAEAEATIARHILH